VTSALQPPHSQPFGGSSFLVLQKRDINWQQSARVAHTHAQQTCTLFTATLRQVRNRRPWCCRGCKPRSPRTWRRLSLSRTWRPLLYYLQIKDNVGFSEMAASERKSRNVTWRTSGSRPAIRELYSATVCDPVSRENPRLSRAETAHAQGRSQDSLILGARLSNRTMHSLVRPMRANARDPIQWVYVPNRLRVSPSRAWTRSSASVRHRARSASAINYPRAPRRVVSARLPCRMNYRTSVSSRCSFFTPSSSRSRHLRAPLSSRPTRLAFRSYDARQTHVRLFNSRVSVASVRAIIPHADSVNAEFIIQTSFSPEDSRETGNSLSFSAGYSLASRVRARGVNRKSARMN